MATDAPQFVVYGRLGAAMFDFDDTLMATRERRVAALIEAAGHFGFTLTPDLIQPHWGKPFYQLVGGMAPGIDYQAFHRHYSQVMRKHPPKASPGAGRTLRTLYAARIPVFVISSGSRELVRQDLEVANLWRYITRLWGYEDSEYHKPDPRVLRPITNLVHEMGLPIGETTYVGDSVADYQVSSMNDVPFVAVLTGVDRREDFLAAGLDDTRIVPSLNKVVWPMHSSQVV